MRGRGGSGVQAGDDREKSGLRRTPLGLRGAPQRGSGPGDPEGKSFSRTQTLQQNAGAEPGPKPRPGASVPPPKLPVHAWGSWVCLIHFINRKEGRANSLWCIRFPRNQGSGRPPRLHLESTAPPNAALPRWGDKWKQQLPSLLPSSLLAWEVMLQQGFPAARRGPADREAAAGYAAPWGWGPGAGEAGPGTALTSSTVSGMQIRYSFSSMVLPAARPRGGKRGAPPKPTKLPPRRRAGRPEPCARSRPAKQPRRCAQLPFSSSPPESMSRFGSGCSGLPRLLPRRARSSRNAVLQSQGGTREGGGRPAGNRSDR